MVGARASDGARAMGRERWGAMGRQRWGDRWGASDGAIEIASIETFVPLA